MKNKTNIILTAIIALSLAFTSCQKQEMDVPPFIIPTFSLSAGDTLITIAQLKAMHPLTLLPSFDSIKNNYYIKGVVTANDESGNIYQSLYIQDATGAIVLATDVTTLSTLYKVGQTVYVKLKNLVYGLPWFGTPQLGGLYNDAPGRLSVAATPNHVFRDGPIGSAPTPTPLNFATDITQDKISLLVRLDSVSFVEAGQPYIFNNTSTNRNITLRDGTNIVVRNNYHATFKDEIMPSGKGSIIAIFSYYNGVNQIYIRNTSDVFGFTTGK